MFCILAKDFSLVFLNPHIFYRQRSENFKFPSLLQIFYAMSAPVNHAANSYHWRMPAPFTSNTEALERFGIWIENHTINFQSRFVFQDVSVAALQFSYA